VPRVKKWALVLLALLLTQLAPLAVQGEPAAEPIQLIVYLYDRCGGCGADNLGCGECKTTVKYHGLIKAQLGDRLYDGTIMYRTLNCRLLEHDRACEARGEKYGMPKDYYGVRPVTYIGGEDSGLYLPGEVMLPYVGAMLDRYAAGEEPGAIQADIAELYTAEKEKQDAELNPETPAE
jgi:hypothetical protein